MEEKTYFPGDPVFNPSTSEIWLSRLSVIPGIMVAAVLAVQHAVELHREFRNTMGDPTESVSPSLSGDGPDRQAAS